MKSIFNNRIIILGRGIRRFIEKKIFFNVARAEVLRRRKISFENIKLVTKDMSYSFLRAASPEINENNDLYGMAYSIKKYAGIRQDQALKASIEHGLYFGDFAWEMDITNNLPCIFTFSQYRKNCLLGKTDKKVFAIGPYLYYVKGYLNDDQIRIKKKKIGKNLTFFPAHSSHFEPVSTNYAKLCEQIKKIASDFDSVTICAYWKDYNKGETEIFERNGFKCVSAGHMFDPNFLSRLKSIIELSSATASNEIGTILGYSVLMNRPHFLLNFDEVKIKKFVINKLSYNYNAKEDELNILRTEFSKYTNKITRCQKNLVNFYWGLDQIKTPSQMKELICESEKAFKVKYKNR